MAIWGMPNSAEGRHIPNGKTGDIRPAKHYIKNTADHNRGRGLIFQAGRNGFYVLGATIAYSPSETVRRHIQAPLPIPDLIFTMLSPYLSVEEGHFDRNGKFVAERRRNGGQVFNGIWVEPDCGVVSVILRD